MTETADQDPEDERPPLAFELRFAITRANRQLARSRPVNTPATGPQVALLSCLAREGDLLVGQLARIQLVRPQSMTQALNKLERKGFIARRSDELDGRRVIVSLTDLGRDVLLDDRRMREEWLARRLEELPSHDVEILRAAVVVLRKLGQS